MGWQPALGWGVHFVLLILLAVFATLPCARADERTAELGIETPVTVENIDEGAFSERGEAGDRERSVPWVLWTQTTQPGHSGVRFGASKEPGVRHLRIAFREAVPVGSVLTKGGGRLSVRREGVEGETDEAWLPAERISGGAVTRDEVDGRRDFAVWVLPPGTRTRVLRFTHEAQAADEDYAGWLGGALVLAERVANVAPGAVVTTTRRQEAAGRLNNESDDSTWDTWDNGPEGASRPVSSADPEWITLAWKRPVKLNGALAAWAGFGAGEVDVFTGPPDLPPRQATAADWRRVASREAVEHLYPCMLGVSGFAFGETVATRALRLRMTAACPKAEGHLEGKTKGGKRVWLGEWLALSPLGDAPLASALPPEEKSEPQAGIAVTFSLAAPAWVTLVIERPDGTRVRNLIAETHFGAGEHTVPWDGMDDLDRDRDAAKHGIRHIPGKAVEPGEYRVRGLARDAVEATWELAVYNAGNPPWETADKTGGWLTNHTPPQAALFVPAATSPTGQPLVYLGSAVSEGGAGLAWVDLEGKKIGGRGWVGGNWTAAPYLARDAGAKGVPGVFAYVGATWTSSADNDDRTHGELRLTGLTAEGDRAVLKWAFTRKVKPGAAGDDDWINQLGGLAAHDGLLVASLTELGKVLFVEAASGRVRGEVAAKRPRGLAFDAQGRLLILTGGAVERWTLDRAGLAKPKRATLVATGLDDPWGLAVAEDGRLAVSDRGASHQVKVFTAEGRPAGVLGRAGPPTTGPHDRLHMNNPHGLTFDGRGRLWVTENDFHPKRVSVWEPDGRLVHAFHGPARYGGGGSLDPEDPTRFYHDGMEFRIDWRTGENEPVAVFHRPGGDDLSTLARAGAPETPLRHGGNLYLTNCHDTNPTGGASSAGLWLMRGQRTVPVAAWGRAADWGLLQSGDFLQRWPAGLDPRDESARNAAFFRWSDANGDGRAQPAEVTVTAGACNGVLVQADFSVTVARLDGRAVKWPVERWTEAGVPVHGAAVTVVEGAQDPTSSGGDQVLTTDEGWSVLTVAPKPFAPESLGGAKDGRPMWSYPSLWPGLHASHEAPAPEGPGEVIGTTRLLGGFVTPRAGDAGPLWAINGNMGNVYVFTADGLFVATLFADERQGKSWAMPAAVRGMSLRGLTLHGENFWPSLTQTKDGAIFLVDGARTSVVRVGGLETIRRLPAWTIRVTAEDLRRTQEAALAREVARQQAEGADTLAVRLRRDAPVVDGKLDDWADAAWVDVDKSGVAAWFDSDSRPHDVSAAVCVAGDRLFAAFRTDDPELLKNAGGEAHMLFKTGGALDVMLGTDAAADPQREKPVAGDVRLLVTRVAGRTVATLFRAVVPGTREPVAFSSPWRTLTLDGVEDVSAAVVLASQATPGGKGRARGAAFEFSVPLAALGLQPQAGVVLRGDLGILRGDGTRTKQRVYWHNKATGITADVPSEAELTPRLWGRWELRGE